MKKITLFIVTIISFVFSAKSQQLSDTTLIGKIITVNIPICRIDVGWNGKKGINNVYAAPAGWQILEFKPKVISKRQRASYSFDLTPSNFAFTSTTIIDTKFDELLQLAAQNGKKEKYEGKIKQLRNDYEKYYKKIITTHSSITTTGSVRGNNEYTSRKPGRLYLDLEIKLVYLPVNEQQFLQSIEFLKAMIKDETL
jgi:hypothetical protein